MLAALTRNERLFEVALWRCGRSPAQGYDCVRQLVKRTEAEDDLKVLTSALNLQAVVEADLGMNNLARQNLMRVRELAEVMGNLAVQVKTSSNLGFLYTLEGRLREAAQEHERAYKLLEHSQRGEIDERLAGRVLVNLADNYNSWDAPERALHLLEKVEDSELPEVQVYVALARIRAFLLLARQQQQLGQQERAGEWLRAAGHCLQQSAHLKDNHSHWYVQAERGLLKAEWLYQNGRQTEAVAQLRHLSQDIRGHNSDGEIRLLLKLAELLQNPVEAAELLRSALTLSHSSGITRSVGKILTQLARRYEEQGQWQEALDIQKQRVAELERVNHQLLRENMEFLQATQEAITLSEDNFHGRLRQAEREARTDGLTGLHNRRSLDEILPGLLERLRFPGYSLHILLADIDHFKQINDTYSHLFGDTVLRRIGPLMVRIGTPPSFGVRYGGEELMLVLQDLSDSEALTIAEQLRHEVEALEWDNGAGPVTLSLGLTRAHPGETALSLLTRADQALYTAKQSGRNRTVVLPVGEPSLPNSR